MRVSFPVVNIRSSRRLGQTAARDMTYTSPSGPATTMVSPWEFPPLYGDLKASMTSQETTGQIREGSPQPPEAASNPVPPILPPPVSNILQNPGNPQKPVPKFLTQQEADKAKNVTGLAVAGGAFAALVGAGLLIFR